MNCNRAFVISLFSLMIIVNLVAAFTILGNCSESKKEAFRLIIQNKTDCDDFFISESLVADHKVMFAKCLTEEFYLHTYDCVDDAFYDHKLTREEIYPKLVNSKISFDLYKKMDTGEFDLIVWSKNPSWYYKIQLIRTGFKYQRSIKLSDRSMITGRGDKEVIEKIEQLEWVDIISENTPVHLSQDSKDTKNNSKGYLLLIVGGVLLILIIGTVIIIRMRRRRKLNPSIGDSNTRTFS